MKHVNKKNQSNRPALQEFPLKWIYIFAAVSLLIHLTSYISIGHYASNQRDNFKLKKNKPIKFNIVSKKQDEFDAKKTIETPLKKTEAPKNVEYAGFEDHKAEKQMRIKRNPLKSIAGAKAGLKGQRIAASKSVLKSTTKIRKNEKKILTDSKSTVSIRNKYEKFLVNSYDMMQGEIDAGYQEYIDEKIEEGDRIDLNTKQYRFIGYFSNFRRSLDLVWTYPPEAARKGLEGDVTLEFKIKKDGTIVWVKLIKSSYFKILDDAIIRAVKEISPLAPLPTSLNKEQVVVTGTFKYYLHNGYAASH